MVGYSDFAKEAGRTTLRIIFENDINAIQLLILRIEGDSQFELLIEESSALFLLKMIKTNYIQNECINLMISHTETKFINNTKSKAQSTVLMTESKSTLNVDDSTVFDRVDPTSGYLMGALYILLALHQINRNLKFYFKFCEKR